MKGQVFFSESHVRDFTDEGGGWVGAPPPDNPNPAVDCTRRRNHTAKLRREFGCQHSDEVVKRPVR